MLESIRILMSKYIKLSMVFRQHFLLASCHCREFNSSSNLRFSYAALAICLYFVYVLYSIIKNTIGFLSFLVLTGLYRWPIFSGDAYIFVFLTAVREQKPDWFSQSPDVKVEQFKGRIIWNSGTRHDGKFIFF